MNDGQSKRSSLSQPRRSVAILCPRGNTRRDKVESQKPSDDVTRKAKDLIIATMRNNSVITK